MLINLKVKTLDAQTHEFSIDNEITVREFKDKIAEKTSIAAEQQRIIYCGRVLADEKQLKEYDVNGKVVHVAERPPPSARAANANLTGGSDAPPPLIPRRRDMRNSPLFRALDGMVVGTMAIPMQAGVNNTPVAINPFTSSSSFCMNRITVARHMLDCANNIAAFLEDPSRGLNNSSLDILAQGRWTMESTVVEVGITAADIPQNQNIVDMLQGAVSAALRRNGNTNVTVVQLPTLFGSSDNADAADAVEAAGVLIQEPMDDADGLNTSTEDEMDAANDADVDDDADDDDDVEVQLQQPATAAASTASSVAAATAGTSAAASSASSTSTTSVSSNASGASANAANAGGNTATGGAGDDQGSRRRTGTNVLADVIDQMRAVQTRLQPYIEQFYDLLRNEPTFEENDTVGRDNAQRLYDRISEAFHYMSHAQHAISDLLLDVSQPAPRFLACRPILVEQSGYVSSNNYLSAAAAAAGLGSLAGNVRRLRTPSAQMQSQAARAQPQAPTAAAAPTATATAAQATAAPAAATAAAAATTPSAGAPVEDPVDDPIVAPTLPTAAAAPNANAATNDNHQMQVARLIEAVVNSAPIDTEFHVQINAPNIVSFGAPGAAVPTTNTAATTATADATTVASDTNASAAANNSSSSTSSPTAAANNDAQSPSNESPSQARATTATLPTTATDTRSTSRPHVQMGGMPAAGPWNGRVMMSSFDRFLPCNSHHIREPEQVNNANTANAGGAPLLNPPLLNPNNVNRVNQRTLRTITDLFQHVRRPHIVGSTMIPPPRSAAAAASAAANAAATGRGPMRVSARRGGAMRTPAAANAASASATAATTQTATATAVTSSSHREVYLRVQLQHFIDEHMFEGVPISADTMTLAVNKALRWLNDKLIFLPQYDLPEYDSRDSIQNLLRHTLPLIINLVKESEANMANFEQRLKHMCEQLFKRLFSILHVCAGRMNAELYWGQLMRSLLVSMRSNLAGDVLCFMQIYVNTEVPTATDTGDVQQFLVLRKSGDNNSDTDTDVEMADVASTSSSAEVAEEPLPNVVVGSEPWHSNFPNDWLPIITHDMETQRDTPPQQAPFSDAYISGMSAKRRKMIQCNKPASDVKSLVADSVRCAIHASGVSSSTASNQSQSPDEITAAIAGDASVQASYSEALRTNVRERLKKDTDYRADIFPQTSKFMNNNK